MADGDKGSPIANAISKTGQDAIATATNRSEANALAGTDGGRYLQNFFPNNNLPPDLKNSLLLLIVPHRFVEIVETL